MNKIAALAEQERKYRQQKVDYQVGIKPNGSRL